MSTHQAKRPYRLYPAYCFRASPTYYAWVKLSIADVHALRDEPDFKGQGIYFYHNHPIQFVTVVGVVIAIEDLTWFCIITLDDGSGATIELKITRLKKDEYNAVESPSNTHVDNLDVISSLGIFEVKIDSQRIDIGTILKAKGKISEFRGKKQLDLKRVKIVPSTNEEVRAWQETATFKRDVLSVPWHITKGHHGRIKEEIRAEVRREKEYERKKAEHEAKKAERKKKYDEYMAKKNIEYEHRRRKEEVIYNAGALI